MTPPCPAGTPRCPGRCGRAARVRGNAGRGPGRAPRSRRRPMMPGSIQLREESGARADEDVEVLDRVAGDHHEGQARDGGGGQPHALGAGGATADERRRRRRTGRGHQHDHAEGPDVAAPGEQVQHGLGRVAVRFVVGDREADDHDRGHGGLEQRAGARGAAGAAGPPEGGGQQPLPPMAKAYRATTLWKLSRAANMPVTKSTCRTSVKVPPSRSSVRKNRSPALCSCAVPTILSGPVATVRAQLLSAKKTATPPTARNMTRGTSTCGRLVSSAHTGACSKPRKAAMQQTARSPRPLPSGCRG